MVIYSDYIVTPTGIIKGYIIVKNNKIIDIKDNYEGEYLDYSTNIIMPGFIDIHIHGWGRGSFMFEKSVQSLKMMAQDQAKEGVTGFLATTSTDSMDEIYRYLHAANEVYNKPIKGSKMLGIHLEGPFINKEFKGMQKEEYCINPNLDIMKELYDYQIDKDMIKLITLAPELKGAKDVIEFCHKHHIQVSIGHSAATFDDIKTLKDYGLGGVTHMFSGMKGLHHRELGVAGSAMYFEDLMCEFAKQTGITVRHEVFDIIYRLKGSDRIIHTTDCLGIAKITEPFYQYTRKINWIPKENNIELHHDDGHIEIMDTKDYESIRNLELSYIESVKNMIRHTPMTLLDISKLTSTNPAKYIGLNNKGSISIGNDADFTILSANFDVITTIVEGNIEYVSD